MTEESQHIAVVIHRDKLAELTWDEYAALTDAGHPRRDSTQREMIAAVDKIATISIDGTPLESAGKVRLADFSSLFEQIGAAVSDTAGLKNSSSG